MAKKNTSKTSKAKADETKAKVTASEKETKKPTAKKTAAKKTAAKKAAPAKKAAAKPTAKKAAAKKATKKAAAKKATVKKTAKAPTAAPARKAAPVKKAAAKKASAASPVAPKLDGGSILPTPKRNAVAPPVTGSSWYLQQRDDARRASLQIEQTGPADYEVELPFEYGETKISVLVRDPEWIYVFWEISNATRAELGLQRGRHNRPLLLRLYDVTGVDFSGNNAVSTLDVPVNDYTSSWYVRVPRAGRRLVVDLGTITEEGTFQTITRSQGVDIPEPRISEEEDSVWAPQSGDVYRQILKLSGGTEITTHMGSEEFVHVLQKKLMENVGDSSFSGQLAAMGIGSSENYSEGVVHRVGQRGRDFWLEVGVDVIVYGATEPDAKVKLMGRPIQLSSDGTFRIRMALPDGTIEFPVEATSADEIETRNVCPIVNRKTV
ncbi:DUF4912 domain-containing protein [bacterium]|nr:DUF4912 domain-containing protein [bacterium]